MRDPRIDPIAGDQVGFRDRPDKRVALRFTDACGEDYIWVTTTRVVKVSNWKRTMRGATVIRKAEDAK